jgi:hypothetical protein
LSVALFIEILQQLLTRQLLAGADDLGDTPIAHLQGPLLAALASEAKANFVAIDRDVTVLQRGDAIAVVLPGVIIVANADERRIQQVDNSGHDLFARQAAQRDVLAHLGPNVWESVGKRDQMLVLGAFPRLTKTWMIAVLLTSPGVAAGGLDVAVRVGADPHVDPGWRHSERLDAPEDVWLG